MRQSSPQIFWREYQTSQLLTLLFHFLFKGQGKFLDMAGADSALAQRIGALGFDFEGSAAPYNAVLLTEPISYVHELHGLSDFFVVEEKPQTDFRKLAQILGLSHTEYFGLHLFAAARNLAFLNAVRQNFDDWEKVGAAFWQIASERNPGFQDTLAKQLQEMHEASVEQILAAEPDTSFDCPPVLFIVFNRPKIAQKAFAAIAKARPKRLYVAADGPRNDYPGEAALCEETRKVADLVDWPCEVSTLFRDENSGSAAKGVSSAISWFFDNEEQGIVIEEDILASLDFFRFCAALLPRFKNNEQVGAISGCQLYDGSFAKSRPPEIQYALGSAYHLWGWATWRRVWRNFRLDINLLDKAKIFSEIEQRYQLAPHLAHAWKNILANQATQSIDTWDFPFVFSMLENGQSVVEPSAMLIENIGTEGGIHFNAGNAGLLYSMPPAQKLDADWSKHEAS